MVYYNCLIPLLPISECPRLHEILMLLRDKGWLCILTLFLYWCFFFFLANCISSLSSSLSEKLKTEGGVFLGDLIAFLPLLYLLFLLFLFRTCEEIIHVSNSASLLILCRISSLLLFPSLALSHLKLCSVYRFPLTLDASCNCNQLPNAEVAWGGSLNQIRVFLSVVDLLLHLPNVHTSVLGPHCV